MSKCVVLISGGMDSAVTAGLAKEAGYEVHALSFDYGQRHKVELDFAKKVVQWVEAASWTVMNIGLREIGGSALTDDNIPVPSNGVGPGVPVTYVPARNIIFLSFGLALADRIQASDLGIGVNALDYSGYPDCRPEFVVAFQRAANLGMEHKVKIWAPLIGMSKAEIVQEAARLRLDLNITMSCYNPGPDGKACGVCDSCRLRAKGIEEAKTPSLI